MQQINKTTFIFFVLFSLSFLIPVYGQNEKDSDSKPIEYANFNFLELPTEKVREIEGFAVDVEGFKVSFIRLGLFTEQEHKLVAETTADEDGKFQFKHIPNGEYRLVARVEYEYFCPVNMKIEKLKSKKKSKSKKRIVLKMNARGIDTCSYGEVK